jgi:acetylornithine deacetylase/succinyl-diaminopimelate desuccinylase-like protein
VEVETWGRPGHGGSVDLHTATHRLIRALDRLLELDEGAEWILATRILGLEGGPAVNVKPRRARAEVELEPAPGTGLATVREAVVEALGRSWLEARVASAPCREKSPRAGGEGP